MNVADEPLKTISFPSLDYPTGHPIKFKYRGDMRAYGRGEERGTVKRRRYEPLDSMVADTVDGLELKRGEGVWGLEFSDLAPILDAGVNRNFSELSLSTCTSTA
jgi:hypothetical protein